MWRGHYIRKCVQGNAYLKSNVWGKSATEVRSQADIQYAKMAKQAGVSLGALVTGQLKLQQLYSLHVSVACLCESSVSNASDVIWTVHKLSHEIITPVPERGALL